MRTLEFYKLPRPVQERFIGACRGRGLPAPLLAVPARRAMPTFWIGLGVALLVALVILMAIGFGSLGSALAIAPVSVLAGYVVCVAGVALAGLRAAARIAAHGQMPFPPGVYLFPVGVVDARTTKLREYRLSELKNVAASPATGMVRLTFARGGSFEFQAPAKEQAEPARVAVLEAQAKEQQAEATHDEHDLAVLDPLLDDGVPSPLMPTEPLHQDSVPWIRFTVPIALGIGLALGTGLWFVRNVASEKRLFSAARAEDTVEAYQAYLARGGSRTDVSDLLLPRAELVVARQAGSVAAIQKFMDEHPDSKIQGEVHAALREALLAELAKAVQAGTVTALRKLAEDHASYLGLVQGEYRAALSNVFKQALTKYQAVAAPGNSDLVPFVKRMLAHAEVNGARVEVRFWRAPTKGKEEADKRIRSNPYYTGVASLPSQYFEDAASRPREDVLGKALVQRLQAAFAPDVLQFSLAERVASDVKSLPKVKVPTLFIEHRAALSGTFLSIKPKAVFVGAGMTFNLTFKLPRSKKTLKHKYAIWRAPDINAVHNDQLTPPQVYEKMTDSAFQKFQEKALAFFFKEP